MTSSVAFQVQCLFRSFDLNRVLITPAKDMHIGDARSFATGTFPCMIISES